MSVASGIHWGSWNAFPLGRGSDPSGIIPYTSSITMVPTEQDVGLFVSYYIFQTGRSTLLVLDKYLLRE
jgi:hypothetical protein